jgi:hypothetical protein
MPPNHARTLRDQQPLSRRARWLLGLSGALAVAAIVALIVTTSSPPARRGCVQTFVPGIIGAQSFDECGPDARRTCATIRGNQKTFGTAGVLLIEKACRKGHIAVG